MTKFKQAIILGSLGAIALSGYIVLSKPTPQTRDVHEKIAKRTTSEKLVALREALKTSSGAKDLEGVMDLLPHLSLRDSQYASSRLAIEKLIEARPELFDKILALAAQTLLESPELPKTPGFGELVYIMHEIDAQQTYQVVKGIIHEIETRESPGYDSTPVYTALVGMIGQWALDSEQESLEFLIERKSNPAAVSGLWNYLRRVPWASENSKRVRDELGIDEETIASMVDVKHPHHH